jgi:hypothetical protein
MPKTGKSRANARTNIPQKAILELAALWLLITLGPNNVVFISVFS